MSTPKYVLVTTTYRGVFAGELLRHDGDEAELANARNCVYWSADCKGFLGLAANGPTASCRIGPAVPRLLLRGVSSISDVTPAAREAWEQAPWKS